jgi:BirA family biotin operon repressor/biotin-[acetyl-CoA-carboxylase] ligase
VGSGVVVLTTSSIEVVAETGSTNSDLIRRLGSGVTLPEGYWLRAERQTGGRGRLGRQWVSPAGNLYCSTTVHLRSGDPPAHSLSFVTGLAVHDMLVSQLSVEPAPRWLKWPNDIVYDGAKMAGMLLERAGDTVVVGIGVNVAFAPAVEGRATTCIHAAHDRNTNDAAHVMDYLAPCFAERLARWRSHGLADTLDQWLARAHRKGTPLRVSDGAQAGLSGLFDGLEADGSLRLRLSDDRVMVINAGEIRLAGE